MSESVLSVAGRLNGALVDRLAEAVTEQRRAALCAAVEASAGLTFEPSLATALRAASSTLGQAVEDAANAERIALTPWMITPELGAAAWVEVRAPQWGAASSVLQFALVAEVLGERLDPMMSAALSAPFEAALSVSS